MLRRATGSNEKKRGDEHYKAKKMFKTALVMLHWVQTSEVTNHWS
jgi:hypothetical protein